MADYSLATLRLYLLTTPEETALGADFAERVRTQMTGT
jgi:hypothetical protein